MSRSLGSTPLTIRPSIETVPALIVSSPATMRRRVDLPQPDGPTTTTSSPSATAQLTPCTTSRVPYDLRTPSRVTVSTFFPPPNCHPGAGRDPPLRVSNGCRMDPGLRRDDRLNCVAASSAPRSRLPAKDALAAGRCGLAEAEFFEAGGHSQPI